MPILHLLPNSPRDRDQAEKPDTIGANPPLESGGQQSSAPQPKPQKSQHLHPLRKDNRIRLSAASRFGDLEAHELIHLIDTLDDERSRARFRESIYISVIIWIAICWFLFYGPRVLFHQPVLRDPIALMREHDKENLTYVSPPHAPRIKPPVLNQKAIQQLQRQARAMPTPQPPAPQPAPPPPPQEAHNVTPPLPTPALPMPTAPRPSPSQLPDLPAAPKPAPNFAQNSQSPGSAIQEAARGALRGRSGADIGAPGSAGPLQAGAQILSDVGDWDPSAYMRRLHNDIQRNWEPLIPEEVQAPLMKKGIVGIRFIIARDGQIADIKLETASGDVALDKAAWYAITSEGQFPPLPKEFKGPQLELRVGFFYNTPIQQ